mmetsp:Transcript_31591/g.50819  ORF Transcript_31591/g.50819 Transcript_31591/m.50819 type:complete len:218 (-) Transcript_31591:394-1047(-)
MQRRGSIKIVSRIILIITVVISVVILNGNRRNLSIVIVGNIVRIILLIFVVLVLILQIIDPRLEFINLKVQLVQLINHLFLSLLHLLHIIVRVAHHMIKPLLFLGEPLKNLNHANHSNHGIHSALHLPDTLEAAQSFHSAIVKQRRRRRLHPFVIECLFGRPPFLRVLLEQLANQVHRIHTDSAPILSIKLDGFLSYTARQLVEIVFRAKIVRRISH